MGLFKRKAKFFEAFLTRTGPDRTATRVSPPAPWAQSSGPFAWPTSCRMCGSPKRDMGRCPTKCGCYVADECTIYIHIHIIYIYAIYLCMLALWNWRFFGLEPVLDLSQALKFLSEAKRWESEVFPEFSHVSKWCMEPW